MDYPQYNGRACSFAELRLKLGSFKTYGFKSVNISESVERGKARGASRRKLALTPGDLDADASIELLEADWLEWLEQLGDGYMDVVFNLHLDYELKSAPGIHSVELKGVSLKKIDEGHSQGTEALTVKLDLDVMGVSRDGKDALGASVP